MVADTHTLTFGHLLRHYRLAAGLTQQVLADRAGVSRRGVDDLERGKRRAPYRDTVQRLATALGLSEPEAAHLESAVTRAHGRLVTMPPRPLDAADSDVLLPRLPTPLTPLLGREREVAALGALLRRDGVRLVTITGAGGIGKTRLSLQVAADIRDAFPDGVWNVRLARIADPGLVIPTLAQVLGVREHGATSLAEALQRRLQDRRALLLLDNFEQVVEAALAVGNLLEYCADVSALVTSRVPLRLRGEHVYALRPLAVPDLKRHAAPEQLAHYPAVALFIERAQAARAEATVTDAGVAAMAEICARLDGLPLAIELAAARTRLLPPPALLIRLERALPVLAGGARDLDRRQQTMRNALAWSYDLLSREEQRLFRRLAVFVGGCTLEAAEAVCAAPEGAEPLGIDMLNGLGALVDQSLVQQSEEGGEARFGMLHVIREFAVEQMEASGEGQAVRRVHANYFRALVERAEDELQSPAQVEWLDRLDRELHNLRATLSWLYDQGDVEMGLHLTSVLGPFWRYRGHHREALARIKALLALPGSERTASGSATSPVAPTIRMRALYVAGNLADAQADADEASAYYDAVESLALDRGDWRMAARAAIDNYSTTPADLEHLQARSEQILALARRAGDSELIMHALGRMGAAAIELGDWARSVSLREETLKYARERGEPWTIAVSVVSLGLAEYLHGDAISSAVHVREGLMLMQRIGDPRRIAECLAGLAWAASSAGNEARVARLLGAAAHLCETYAVEIHRSWRDTTAAVASSARTALGEDAWQAAYAAGRALSLEEAVAEALGEKP